MLFREQMEQLVNTQHKEFVQINNWDEVREQLKATFVPNYQGINQYIQNHMAEGLP